MGGRIGNDLERQVVEAIAGQHRGRFVECAVNGRLSAAKIIIIHARQIVMYQRIDVDCLDCRAGTNGPLLGKSEQAAGGNRQQRPKPLPTAEPGVAHGLEQPVAAVAGADQIFGKDRFDLGGDAGCLGAKLGPGHAGLNQHRTGSFPLGGHRDRVRSSRSWPVPP